MKILESLTKKQELLIPKVREEWLGYFYKNKGVDKKKAIQGVSWLYNFCGKKKPTVLFMDSPLGCEIMKNLLKMGANIQDNIGDNIGANIRDNIGANIGANIRDNIWANIWDNIGVNIGDNIRDNVRDNVRVNIRDNVRDNIGVNIGANIQANIGANIGAYHPSYYGNVSDYGWVAFYDFFYGLNFFTDYKWDNFNKFKDLLKSGIYEINTFENVCIVCSMPKVIQNNNNNLHSVNEAAVKFNDDFEMFFVNGRMVDKNIIDCKFTFDDFIKEENEDIKACMITVIKEKKGDKALMDFMGAEIIDEKIIKHGKTEQKHPLLSFLPNKDVEYLETIRLYKTKQSYPFLQDRNGNFNQPYCWSEMVCPSTGSTYFIENSADFNDAIEAVKFLRPSFVPQELEYNWNEFAN